MLFALDVSQRDGLTVVAVTGELELATAPRLRQQVVALVGAGHDRIVLDLSGVDFVDSVGLGVIVAVLKRVRTHGGDLVVAGATTRVRGLFEITRLDEIVELVPDIEAVLGGDSTPARGFGTQGDG